MKEKYKTLLQAMILPLIVVGVLLYGSMQVYDAMTGDSDDPGIAQSLDDSPENDPIVNIFLFTVIAISISTLIVGTLILYSLIDWVKKRKSEK